MKNKTTLLNVVVTAMVLLPIGLLGKAKDEQPKGADKKPNIIVMMADDLNSGELSCYGGQNLRTKHIDALASQGLKFDQMICSEAMCIPTRASLFTGLYPMHHGAFQNHKPVFTGLKSVCQYLGEQDYTVALTGKNHVTKPFPFEFIKGFEPNCVSATDDYELEDIRNFISDKKESPFCLFVMSINPHAPWTVGDPSEFDPAKVVLPPHLVDTRQVREEYCKYLAEVRRLDDQVGDMMALLKETGLEDNTIFIFLGEQGPQFPGGKWTLWDNGQKSSMIVKWPGTVKPNTVTNAIVQYEDVTPTLVDIAGGKSIAGLDGLSFLEVLKGKKSEHRDFAFGIHNNIPEGKPYPIRSVRDNKYKLLLNLKSDQPYYIKYMMNPEKVNSYWMGWLEKAKTSAEAKVLVDRVTTRPAIEFYDLEKDPYELNNLAKDPAYTQLVKKYETELRDWMKAQGDEGAAVDKVYAKHR